MNGHGGNIYRLSEEIKMAERKIIDFSASINPLGVSKKVKAALIKNIKYLCNYPDPETVRLRRYIGRHHNIDPETILCGNGSTEIIYLIARALKPDRVLIPAPAFSEYERAFKTDNGSWVMSYGLEWKNNFDVMPDDFISAMEDMMSTKFIPPPLMGGGEGEGEKGEGEKGEGEKGEGVAFLCNPNNPTGRLLKKRDVLKIAEAAKRVRCHLIVDEAFIDFCPEDSVITEVRHNPYLIVIRSITKFYALPGLRIGYGIFPMRLIGILKDHKEPWNVNSLAEIAAIAALKDKRYREETVKVIHEEKEFLKKGFKKMGIEFLYPDANFYLLKTGKAGEVYHALKAKGILVRDCSNFRGLDSTYLRVAVRLRKDNMRLVKELSALL